MSLTIADTVVLPIRKCSARETDDSPAAKYLKYTQTNCLVGLFLSLDFQLRQRLVYFEKFDYKGSTDKVVKDFKRIREPLTE